MERSGAQQLLNGLERSIGWDPIDPAGAMAGIDRHRFAAPLGLDSPLEWRP